MVTLWEVTGFDEGQNMSLLIETDYFVCEKVEFKLGCDIQWSASAVYSRIRSHDVLMSQIKLK